MWNGRQVCVQTNTETYESTESYGESSSSTTFGLGMIAG
jgi:hypothetical protein